jgi:putative DNA primase/helicase
MKNDLISTPEERTHADDVFERRFSDDQRPPVELPEDLRMKEDGLCVEIENSELRVSGRFWIKSRSRDFDGENHGVEVEFHDYDGALHTVSVSHADLVRRSTAVIEALRSKGLWISTAGGRIVVRALADAKVRPVSRRVTRIGWQGQGTKVFVLPDLAFGAANEPVKLADDLIKDSGFSRRGTLEDWQKTAVLASGNHIVMLATCIAFAGPVLRLVEADSMLFHLRGSSSIGKTTAARFMSSVWGKPTLGDGGFMRTWRSTTNALELLSASRCDTGLVLDEVNMASPREVGNAAYLLASGSGKERMSQSLTKAPVAKWRIATLSTGEVSLRSYVQSHGEKMTGGQSVRFVDIPADAKQGFGIFQNLHDAETASAFARRLTASLDESYGHAGPAFIRELVARQDDAREFVLRMRSQFETDHCPERSDPQVRRVCAQFGLVAAAGALASELGVVPWSQAEILHAATFCFNSWLSERGHLGSHEIAAGIAQLRKNLLRQGQATASNLNSTGTMSRYGFCRSSPVGNSGYYVFQHEMDDMLKGFAVKEILEHLKGQGYLRTDPDRLTTQARHPVTNRNTRFYCVSLDFVHGDEAETTPT